MSWLREALRSEPYTAMNDVNRADPAVRKFALIALSVMTVIGVALIVSFESALENLSPDTTASQLTSWLMGWIVLCVSVPLSGFAIWLWLYGSKIRNAQRFPPADARTVRDVSVRVDQDATRIARIGQAMAAILLIAAWTFTYYVYLLLQNIVPD